MLLEEGESNAQQHHNGDDRGGPLVAEKKRDSRQAQQQEIEWVPGATEEFGKQALSALMRDEVRAVECGALLRPPLQSDPAASWPAGLTAPRFPNRDAQAAGALNRGRGGATAIDES